MIIPIKCFTCGAVIADKYRYYLEEVRRMKIENKKEISKVVYFTNENMTKTEEGIVLDKMRILNVCCRRHFLTHVDVDV